MNGLTVGKLARETGVGIETLRFYEREGLIPEPARRASGYRDYPPETVERVRFIRRAKALGFSLRQIAELFALRVDETRTCADVRERATAKIAEIDDKLTELTRMKAALQRLAVLCTGTGPTGACPILEALEADDGSG